MGSDVVNGMCDLLRQKENRDIVRFTIKGCTFISMNYEFINAPSYCVPILKELINLIEHFNCRNDKYNLIYAIRNILKGSKENKQAFMDMDFAKKFVNIILPSKDI